MLGRREEEAEREEMERQMREQEEMELEMERGEELARQMRLREQQQQAEGAGGEEIEQRNLDDDVPDADEGPTEHDEHGSEREGDADLDDEIPDADADNAFVEEDDNVEGQTGITDEVEHTNLGGEDSSPLPTATTDARPGNRGAQNLNEQQVRVQAAHGAPQAYTRRQDQEQAEQEALANAMLDEDEQAFAERDLDAGIPEQDENGMEGRDLDNDVPEADEEYGEGEWQHTDTELDEDESAVMLMEAEGDVSMDMSVIDGRRSVSGVATAATGNVLASSLVEDSSMLQTPATGNGSRRWLNPRSLSGMGRTGNLFASGGSPQSPTQIQAPTEPQEEEQAQQPPRRRSGRRALGRENRSARESLD